MAGAASQLPFARATRRWFAEALGEPTVVQRRGWPAITRGEHTLLLAPTGSGKTLAAFLCCIDRLCQPSPRPPGVRVVYVSPLKALVYDIERNLRQPLAGIAEQGAERVPGVDVRTGDTSQRERRRQRRAPQEILVTTPESLFLILTSRQREALRTVETVIVDEVHALAPGKRGAHLALSLERLAQRCAADPQRIGLSATARPAATVAAFLGGPRRQVTVVDAAEEPRLELAVTVPLEDLTRPGDAAGDGPVSAERRGSVWPALLERLLQQIVACRSTIVFVNARGLCERLCQRLNELAGEELALAHHGSLARERREAIEERLKRGDVRAIVATSSLELGIDMGAVDQVLLVESPRSVARGLQRVGRAGHRVGQVSRGAIYPKHRGDLLETAVIAQRMKRGEIEAVSLPRNPLDVLAQQIVASCAMEAWPAAALWQLVRSTASFAKLERELFDATLRMLGGHYPSTELADLRPRLRWDRRDDMVHARRGARALAVANAGTIPDRGLFPVHLAEGGPRVGELDEEMVNETPVGQTFALGASSYRVEQVTRDRVVVSPAPGEQAKLPFWKGSGPGRPVELGRALGAFTRRLTAMDEQDARRWLASTACLDRRACDNLLAHLAEQRRFTGVLPSDRTVVVERFRDELGDWRVCLLSPWGSRVHAPWALALQARVAARAGSSPQAVWTDDGIALRLAGGDAPPPASLFAIAPDAVEALVVQALGRSALFASQFRENAARALLLPRRRPGARVPLWVQRLRAQSLQAVAQGYPDFPIVLESYRSCLQDTFDMPALHELLSGIASQAIAVAEVETPRASPFSRSLGFAYADTFLYDGDMPAAEQRAQALLLDHELLDRLLDEDTRRQLLDPAELTRTADELQGTTAERRARDADELCDLLRRLGDLDEAELAARSAAPVAPWLAALTDAGQIAELRVAGARRYVLAEERQLFADALDGAGEAADAALEQLLRRFKRTRGPFTAEQLVRRYALPPARVAAQLRALERQHLLVGGAFSPREATTENEWCDPDVLRRLRRRTLARLRAQIAPVPHPALARFLARRHGLLGGSTELEAALERLEGLELSLAELEGVLLPMRLGRLDPAALDALGASGRWVWIGGPALAGGDCRVTLARRERARLLAGPPASADSAGDDALQRTLLDQLAARGACFFAELLGGCAAPQREVVAALWALVHAGLVTNDTLAPVRGRGARGRRGSDLPSGRWSLVGQLLDPPPSFTERAVARARLLLRRYGIACRQAAAAEGLAGGFAAIYDVLRAMEDAGQVRRGHFVAELAGPQFAEPAVVDQLRASRQAAPGQALALAASDPANPYGALLPWPPRAAAAGAPRRVAGAAVLLYAGRPLLFVERGGRSAITFTTTRAAQLRRCAAALGQLARRQRGRYLRLEQVDGERATRCAIAPALREIGFAEEPKGLVLEA